MVLVSGVKGYGLPVIARIGVLFLYLRSNFFLTRRQNVRLNLALQSKPRPAGAPKLEFNSSLSFASSECPDMSSTIMTLEGFKEASEMIFTFRHDSLGWRSSLEKSGI